MNCSFAGHSDIQINAPGHIGLIESGKLYLEACGFKAQLIKETSTDEVLHFKAPRLPTTYSTANLNQGFNHVIKGNIIGDNQISALKAFDGKT